MVVTATDIPHARLAPWLNLLLPGGGLIMINAAWSGLLIGLAFVVAANIAVVAVLLFPDDFSAGTRGLLIGLAGGCYVGAQWRYAQTVRDRRERALAARRRRALEESRLLLLRGEHDAALESVQPLAELLPRDLLVAYRVAQVLTAAGNRPAAEDAWQCVRDLDKHGIYRQQTLQGQRNMSSSTFP